MHNFYRQFLPKKYDQIPKDDQIKAKFLAVNAGSTVLWGPVMVVILYFLGSPITALTVLYGFFISITSILTLRQTSSVKLSARIFVIGLFIMYLVAAFFNNGIHFGGLIWMMILPLLALNTLNFKASLYTLFGCLSLVIILNTLDSLGMFISNEASADDHQRIYYISLLLVTPIMLAMGVSYRDLLRSALVKERELNVIKTKFVSNVSHELRTPLNGIIGIIEAMKQQPTDVDLKEDIRTIEYSSHHLLAIVNDILDLAESQRIDVKFENAPYRIKDNINEVIRSLTPLAQSKDLELSYWIDDQLPDVLVGDSKRIDQLILNFLGNSLKFTHRGGVNLQLESEIDPLDENQIKLKFTVKDTGIGIGDHDLKNLFQPFYQVDDSSTRKYAGSGLGLTISQQIIESLGGEIIVSSELGKGSSFAFSVNQTVPSEHSTVSIVDSRHGMDDKVERQFLKYDSAAIEARILVAEDNAINQLVLKKMLNVKNHKVTMVSNGLEALAQLAENEFDIILLDGHMPELDGFETAITIRKEMGLTLPIIAVTAGATKADHEKCIASGMDEVLSKPILANTLYRCLDRWLQKKEET